MSFTVQLVGAVVLYVPFYIWIGRFARRTFAKDWDNWDRVFLPINAALWAWSWIVTVPLILLGYVVRWLWRLNRKAETLTDPNRRLFRRTRDR